MRRYGLYERERELGVLEELTGRLRDGRGGALVLTGGPGSGKSALLSAATRIAADGRIRILQAAGVRSETRISFAGLHRLLQPVLDLADDLPPARRQALHEAFWLTDRSGTDLLKIGLATVALLGKVAARQPTLLLIDDAQWLDQASGAVLSFAARRLDDKAALILAAGDTSPFVGARLPELELAPLSEYGADALIDRRWPDLGSAVRERVLAIAGGNPLALIELPAASPARHAQVPLPSPVELTPRLEHAFNVPADALPAPPGWGLRVRAADDQAAPAEVVKAASKASGTTVTMASLWPATRAGVIDVRGDRFEFRHEVHRLPISQAAGHERRLAAHAALADVLAGQADRQVWHRAAATFGPDERVAAELDQAASRAERRGSVALAAAAMERAA